MSQLVQTIWFNTSSALSGEVSVKPSLECLQKVEGCLKVMHGFQAENTSRAVVVIFWRSFQDYTNWTTQQDYSSFISLLPISLANSLEIQMVDFKVDPSEAFSCPITEIATMKFQEGSTKQQMDAVFHSFMNLRPKISRELDQPGDNYPKYFAWGEVEGVPYTYCFSLGWDSLEVRTTISEARQTSVVKTILENGELIPNYFTAPQKDWETARRIDELMGLIFSRCAIQVQESLAIVSDSDLWVNEGHVRGFKQDIRLAEDLPKSECEVV